MFTALACLEACLVRRCVLRLLPLWVEPQTQLDSGIWDFFANWEEVQAVADPIAGDDQLARIGGVEVHSLSNRSRREPSTFPIVVLVIACPDEVGVGVVEDIPAPGVGRPRFHGPDPPPLRNLRQGGVRHPPLVLPVSGNGVWG